MGTGTDLIVIGAGAGGLSGDASYGEGQPQVVS